MATATTTHIEDLFDKERLPQGWLILPILFYFPLGLTLALLRLFIGLHTFLVACVLPKTASVRSFVLRTMCFVLGIVVNEGDEKHKNKAAKILVTNHVTMLDHLAIDLVLPCTVPSVWDLPRILTWCLGFKDLGVKHGRDVLIQNVQRHCQESDLPILAHPEGATTNGKVGLLKFSSWPFSIGQPVSPIIVEVRRPYLLSISTSVIGSRWWSDFFWFLYSPCTTFNIRYLPEMCCGEESTADEFSREVQDAMADALGVKATNFTCADKVEHLKRVLFSPSHPGQQMQLETSPHITRMAYQVKEVLPYVPLEAIKKDLVRTNSVSLTISNILEGVVHYTPEPERDPAPASALFASTAGAVTRETSPGKSSLATVSPSVNASGPSTASDQYYSNFNTSATSFGKSADERMLSFQERKLRLLESARRRYKEKHGL